MRYPIRSGMTVKRNVILGLLPFLSFLGARSANRESLSSIMSFLGKLCLNRESLSSIMSFLGLPQAITENPNCALQPYEIPDQVGYDKKEVSFLGARSANRESLSSIMSFLGLPQAITENPIVHCNLMRYPIRSGMTYCGRV